MTTRLNFVENIFIQKPTEFYSKDIKQMLAKWQNVTTNDGEYIIKENVIAVY